MFIKFALALLLFSVLGEVVGTDNVDVHESQPEKPASQKGRLSLQNTGKRFDESLLQSRKAWTDLCARGHVLRISEQSECAVDLNAKRTNLHLIAHGAVLSDYERIRYLVNTEHGEREIQYLRKLLIALHKVGKDR